MSEGGCGGVCGVEGNLDFGSWLADIFWMSCRMEGCESVREGLWMDTYH